MIVFTGLVASWKNWYTLVEVSDGSKHYALTSELTKQ